MQGIDVVQHALVVKSLRMSGTRTDVRALISGQYEDFGVASFANCSRPVISVSEGKGLSARTRRSTGRLEAGWKCGRTPTSHVPKDGRIEIEAWLDGELVICLRASHTWELAWNEDLYDVENVHGVR